MEGWCRLIDGWSRSYRHVRSTHCEMSGPMVSPANSRPFPDSPVPATSGDGMAGGGLGPGTISPARVVSNSSPHTLKTTASGGFLENNSGRSPGPVPSPPRRLRDPGMEGDFQQGYGHDADFPPVTLGSNVDRVWATLRATLLLFAKKPSRWAPYAFTQICGIQQQCDAKTLTIVLTATPKPIQGADNLLISKEVGLDEPLTPRVAEAPMVAHIAPPPISMIFLLPDGRWQKEEVPRLELQLPDARTFDRWRSALASQCLAASESGTVSA